MLEHARVLERENAELREFAQRVMKNWPEGDVDGGELQEIAVGCGLLQPVEMTGPCGEHCSCAEHTDFPAICLRHTKLLTGES